MDPSLRRQLLWFGAGLILYLVGFALFLGVIVGALSPGGGIDMEAIASGSGLLLLLASTALFVAGGFCMQKGRSIGPADAPVIGGWMGGGPPAGRGSRGSQSDIPEQFRVREPPEGTDRPDDLPGIEPGTAGSDVVVCPNCRAENEDGFDFCWNCSEEL